MGRNVSAGILTNIEIVKKNNHYSSANFDLKKEINNVLKEINKMVDITAYDIKEDEDGFILKLKQEYLKENFYDLFTEMTKINNEYGRFYNCLNSEEKFPIEKEKIDISIDEENEYQLHYGEEKSSNFYIFYPLFWILSAKSKLYDDVSISGSILPIWVDIDKIDGEDETSILWIMNMMKNKFFKSKLSKCLIFEIIG